MTVGRKAIKRNIDDLIDLGYDIEYNEIKRTHINPKTGEAEDTSLQKDFMLVRDFCDSELHLLIDSVMCSRFIPEKQSR